MPRYISEPALDYDAAVKKHCNAIRDYMTTTHKLRGYVSCGVMAYSSGETAWQATFNAGHDTLAQAKGHLTALDAIDALWDAVETTFPAKISPEDLASTIGSPLPVL